jgi:tetratricopeptide (TPR) repeat protein
LIPSNKTAALSRLNDIVRLPTLPASFLERASILYQSLEMPEAALKSIKTAVARPGANIETHHRFALLLAHSGRTRQARAELAAVLSNAEPQLHQLHMLGELALQLSDYPLALRFAEAQFRRDPRNPGCILFLARYTRFAGDRARARVLLSALYDVERRSPLLSNEQWATLAQELYDVYDLALARAAALEVLARQPHHPEARELLAATELVERHGVSLETVSAPDRNLPKQQTVAGSWIARIWGR